MRQHPRLIQQREESNENKCVEVWECNFKSRTQKQTNSATHTPICIACASKASAFRPPMSDRPSALLSSVFWCIRYQNRLSHLRYSKDVLQMPAHFDTSQSISNFSFVSIRVYSCLYFPDTKNQSNEKCKIVSIRVYSCLCVSIRV